MALSQGPVLKGEGQAEEEALTKETGQRAEKKREMWRMWPPHCPFPTPTWLKLEEPKKTVFEKENKV